MNGSDFLYNDFYRSALILILTVILVILIVIIIREIQKILASPFKYPYYYVPFDVSGKRNPDMSDYIDKYLCNTVNWKAICRHEKEINKWKAECKEEIEESKLKDRRRRQYKEALDDDHAYRFEMKRRQTRYRQRNYMRSSYNVYTSTDRRAYSFDQLADRRRLLAGIGFETSLRRYNEAEQRKLMTPQLRQYIMRRDNYTCQICGKYMPDGVGLQIDHIIPVSKGGKTVPSNLRVLCSKCNGRKGNKLD
ncbi:HNH endonuclease [Lactimicrobium massiliense]|uniref:HNH endonuclease n=1 Tax=Lactimicrobium massiliense TaxID=2161814 RepID=UPI000D553329|nr:HNH endonuclease [Lactimicrobium massiliense]